MQNLIKVLNYEGNDVTFRTESGITYVNATEMAKPFGKRPGKWTELTTTTSFLTRLSCIRKTDTSKLIFSVMGSPENGGGTWMHEDVAIEFARWVSDDFGIWCNDRIKEVLTHGMTATPSALEEMILSPDMVIGLATKLKEERLKSQMLEQTNTILESTVKVQAPKAEYFDKVLQSESLLTTTEIAALLGKSAKALNKDLNEKGIQWRVNGRWVLTVKYNNLGYAKDKTVPVNYDEHGEVTLTATSMYWTEKGKHFILSLYKESKTA